MPPLPNSPRNRLRPNKRELTFAVAAVANGLPERSDKSLGSQSVTAVTTTQQMTAARSGRTAPRSSPHDATELLINCQLRAASWSEIKISAYREWQSKLWLGESIGNEISFLLVCNLSEIRRGNRENQNETIGSNWNDYAVPLYGT